MIEIQGLKKSYGSKLVLDGVHLTVPDGAKFGLVGINGAGKSTLLRLIADVLRPDEGSILLDGECVTGNAKKREELFFLPDDPYYASGTTIAKLIASMWDVGSGKITIGGKDIREIPLEQLNQNIAYVAQDNFLFNESVRENIRKGNLAATDEEVENIAKASGCHEFIMKLENGYDTVVGSSGGHLSGGERQRIAIARAMLKNAPVVILDEATAYTDPENEAVIQSAVSKLVQGKTLIVVAHRLSTIVDSDKIFLVNDGKIEASGTHEELLKSSALYNELWQAHIGAKDRAED